MFKKVQYGIVMLGLPLYLNSMTAIANSTQICQSISPPVAESVDAHLCDVSFSALPTFSCLSTFPQTGVYTLTNNSPITISIGTPSFTSDSMPAGSTTITANNCTTLAPGASCSMTVTMFTPGPFTRVLQIPITGGRQTVLRSPIVTPTVGCVAPTPIPPSPSFPCALGSTSTYGVLAGSAITNTGATIINGDLGLSPGTAVTGFPPGLVTGSTHINDGVAATAQSDLTTLFNCLAAQPCGTVIGTADQAGVTHISTGPGAVNVYCSGSSILNSGTLTLSGDANSVFIFQAGSTLTMGTGSTIVLTGGATAANVFWQVGSSATIGAAAAFQGTITALTSITLVTGATINDGRALARNGAVTFDTNIVTVP